MMLDHLTVHVQKGVLSHPALISFMSVIGYREVEPDDPMYEHDLPVKWFAPIFTGPVDVKIHLVEGLNEDGLAYDKLALGHFCIRMTKSKVQEIARRGRYVTRDSGSGRIWLGFANIRVEVRP